ncbi:esterase/lipase family protein [Micromonospora chalcea]
MTTSTDFVVVLPGILGSTLRRHGDLVWAPSAGSALRAIRTFGRNIQALRLPDGLDDEHPADGVEPAGLMPDLHVLPGIWTPVKGYDRLLSRLRSIGYRDYVDDLDAPPGNLLPVAYDWRLSNRYNGRRLARLVEPALERWRAQGGPYTDAKVTFVCHSMGGLVARWYIERCGGAETTHKLITVGTPYRGSAKALEQLVNGAHKGTGRLGIDLTDLVRSMPSMYQLLPEYACIERRDGLAKTAEIALPELATDSVADGIRFHAQLAEAETSRPASLTSTHAIVGIHQPTATTARLVGSRIELVNSYRADELYGDATVPIVAASRPDVPMDSPLLRRVPDQHGNLQRNKAVLDEIHGILTASPITVRAPHAVALHVDAPDLLFAGDPLPIRVGSADDSAHPVRVTVTDENQKVVDARVARPRGGEPTTVLIEGLPSGAYTIDVGGLTPSSPIAPVSSDTLFWSNQPE